MARTGFFHHIGTFFLFAAVVLLIITDISAPVVADISLLRVELDSSNSGRQPVITFGTFGWCTQDVMANGNDFCTRATVGYDPTSVLEEYLSSSSSSSSSDTFSDAATATSRALTRVFVLHPIATGLAFVSFLLAAGAGFIGSLLASLGSLLTFVVVVVALVCDFVGLAIVRGKVNDDGGVFAGSGASASWGSAAWTILVAAICCLIASVVLFFTCCSARIHGRREARAVKY
ncbi:actin cortical patch SUR7/pH-response regulator pali [Biscogniauxia marginata]|nr:actin cortical patch SUR7/pH-response regulator pali [Biscogniauxia marginata]